MSREDIGSRGTVAILRRLASAVVADTAFQSLERAERISEWGSHTR